MAHPNTLLSPTSDFTAPRRALPPPHESAGRATEGGGAPVSTVQFRSDLAAEPPVSAVGESVEMSAYIPVRTYDLYEEKHAYYVEMMNRMLALCTEDRGADSEACRMLDLGAGTGNLTRRLAWLPAAEVHAVELDWQCFDALKRNVASYGNVTCSLADSCEYRPDLPVHYAFSAFSDHHIKPARKVHYVENIRECLLPQGRFIVGDEFLPDHDVNSRLERYRALINYHGHIIDVANEQARALETEGQRLASAPGVNEVEVQRTRRLATAHAKLAELETAALHSGLEGLGDFKLTCREYERVLTDGGLQFFKEKIGPIGRDDVGGVYVYVAWRA